MKKIILSAILFFISFPLFSQWTQTNGIKGCEMVYSIHKTAHSVLAGTSRGLFRSTNNGISWTVSSAGFKYYDVRSLASKGDTVFAGSMIGIYVSYDDGINWQEMPFQNSTVTCLLYHNNRLFVGVVDELYYSDDYGQTYDYIGTFDYMEKLFAYGNYIYIAAFGSGVYRSSDNGLTWVTKNNGLVSLNTNDFISSGNYLFVSSSNVPDGNVYRSTNNGDNWSACANSFQVNSISALSGEGNYVYAASGNMIYLTSNNGTNWSDRTGNLPASWVTSMMSYDNYTFVQPLLYNIYRTTNQGMNWSVSDSGFNNTDVKALVTAGNYIFAAAGIFGIWRTSDNGSHWSNLPLLLSTSDPINNIRYINNTLYACGSNTSGFNLCHSTDFGNHWIFMGGIPGTYVNDIALKDTVLFVATFNGVKRSYDGGLNWSQTSISTSLNVNKLLVRGNYLYAAADNGLYYTTNNGNTWLTSSGINNTVYDIVSHGGVLFASTYNRICKSTNNGINWTAMNLNTIYNTGLYSVNNALLAATRSGVVITTNNEQNWSNVSDGLSLLESRCLLSLNDYVFLGTNGAGVYKRPVSQIIGIRNISSGIPDNFSLYQNYPNPFNPVTKIKFDVAQRMGNSGSENVVIEIFDALGKRVKTLVNEPLQPGSYEVTLNGSGLPSGVYFYRMLAGGEFKNSRKMVLMK